MLKGDTLQFHLNKRKNSYSKKGIEWALGCNMGSCSPWIFKTYIRKPAYNEVSHDIELIVRAFDFYHRHLEIPFFPFRKENIIINMEE